MVGFGQLRRPLLLLLARHQDADEVRGAYSASILHVCGNGLFANDIVSLITSSPVACEHIVFPYCPCTRIATSLISIGYFPTAPKDPQTAFSINLLDHYRHLQDHTSDSITSLAASLRDSLEEKGFLMLTPKVS